MSISPTFNKHLFTWKCFEQSFVLIHWVSIFCWKEIGVVKAARKILLKLTTEPREKIAWIWCSPCYLRTSPVLIFKRGKGYQNILESQLFQTWRITNKRNLYVIIWTFDFHWFYLEINFSVGRNLEIVCAPRSHKYRIFITLFIKTRYPLVKTIIICNNVCYKKLTIVCNRMRAS